MSLTTEKKGNHVMMKIKFYYFYGQSRSTHVIGAKVPLSVILPGVCRCFAMGQITVMYIHQSVLAFVFP